MAVALTKVVMESAVATEYCCCCTVRPNSSVCGKVRSSSDLVELSNFLLPLWYQIVEAFGSEKTYLLGVLWIRHRENHLDSSSSF